MSRKLRRRDADIQSAAAAAARRSVTIGGGGVIKMSAARTALVRGVVDELKNRAAMTCGVPCVTTQ